MNRFDNLNLIWASSGSAKDPDLDTTFPTYTPNKFIKGWVVEKEPSQWQNYLYQITDLKNQMLAQEQVLEWESDVSYRPRMVVRVGESFYLQISTTSQLNKAPASNPTIWTPVFGTWAKTITDATAVFKTKLVAHLAEPNPHKDTAERVGIYEKTFVDKAFSDVTDPKTLPYHMAKTGRAHNETVQQLRCLPVAGGTFTGDVSFDAPTGLAVILEGTTAGLTANKAEMANSSGAISPTKVRNNATGVESEILSENNYGDMQISSSPLFALPQPLIYLDLRTSLSCMGISNQVVSCTAPVFEKSGLTFESAKTLDLSNGNMQPSDTTAILVYVEGGVKKRWAYFTPNSNYKPLGTFLNSRPELRNASHICELFVYPKLTDYQIIAAGA